MRYWIICFSSWVSMLVLYSQSYHSWLLVFYKRVQLPTNDLSRTVNMQCSIYLLLRQNIFEGQFASLFFFLSNSCTKFTFPYKDGNCKLIWSSIRKGEEYSILQPLYNLSFPMLWLAMEIRHYPYMQAICCKDKHLCTVILQRSCRSFPKNYLNARYGFCQK